jgi:hypothetical protein
MQIVDNSCNNNIDAISKNMMRISKTDIRMYTPNSMD